MNMEAGKPESSGQYEGRSVEDLQKMLMPIEAEIARLCEGFMGRPEKQRLDNLRKILDRLKEQIANETQK